MSDFSRKSAQNRPFCKSALYIYMGGLHNNDNENDNDN